MHALLGFTGFVGSYLREDLDPHSTEYFNSKNFGNVVGREFGDVYCACIPAVKWWANSNPVDDMVCVKKIVDTVKTIACERLILISTIDVHDMNRENQTESCEFPSTEAYGFNRKHAEDELREFFGDRLFVFRLPALFGIGLKKNVLFDLMNDNRVENVNGNSCFQWYSLEWLYQDIQSSLDKKRYVTNLYSEPVETSMIVAKFFPLANIDKSSARLCYNHSSDFGLKSSEHVLEGMTNYIRVADYVKYPNRMVISNMAWDPEYDDHAIFLLKRYGVRNVEIIPTKYETWESLFSCAAPEFSRRFASHGISVYSLQSVLYGVDGDFATNSVGMANHLEKVVSLCRSIGGSVLVVGSPSKRSDENCGPQIADVLGAVQDGNHDIRVCLEPNSKEYGCRVGTTLDSCLDLRGSSEFFINFDTGNRIMEADRLPRESDVVGHCQISGPFLRPLRHRDYSTFQTDGTFGAICGLDGSIKVSLEVKVPVLGLGEQVRRFVSFMSQM